MQDAWMQDQLFTEKKNRTSPDPIDYEMNLC